MTLREKLEKAEREILEQYNKKERGHLGDLYRER